MARNGGTTTHPETPVQLTSTREGQHVVYQLNIHHHGMRQQVLDAYDAEDVDDLAAHHLDPGQEVVTARLGVIRGSGDDADFQTDESLLKRVDGVTDTLAAALIDEYGDLEQLCERLREDGDTTLSTTLADAQVAGKPWTDDLEELLDELREDLEQFKHRVKAAGVWVKPAATSNNQ